MLKQSDIVRVRILGADKKISWLLGQDCGQQNCKTATTTSSFCSSLCNEVRRNLSKLNGNLYQPLHHEYHMSYVSDILVPRGRDRSGLRHESRSLAQTRRIAASEDENAVMTTTVNRKTRQEAIMIGRCQGDDNLSPFTFLQRFPQPVYFFFLS